MKIDISRISEQVNAFWGDYGYAVVAAVGALVFGLVVTAVVKVARSRQRDRWVAGLTALVVLAWTSEGLWEVAYGTLGLPLAFSIMTFFVYESMMLTSALQAERHRKHHPSPGPAGRYVWVLASITAGIVALNAATVVEALLRFTLPLAAAGLWWVGITADREDDSDEVKRLREAERARRKAIWAIDLRRLLVAAGVMKPGTQTLTDAERERRIRQMVTAADQLHAAQPDTRRARRASNRLRRLARLASANDIATVRARVARATRITDLVMPAANPPPGTGDSASAVHRNGNVSGPAVPVSREAGGVPPETGPDLLGETAPFHPDPRAGAPRNGAVPTRPEPVTDSHDGARTAAERVYRDSVRAGQPLTAREVAARVGCSRTTAWRGIRAFQAASRATSPNGADPSHGGSSRNTDVLVKT